MVVGGDAVKGAIRFLLVLAACAFSQWSAPQVGSFAVATLREEAIAKRLRERFKATGAPVFLMGNPGVGLQQGDMVRFVDKAILVDADVWQTLAAEGALQALKQAPLVRVKASANPAAWAGRARMISSPREKTLYEFGSSLLKILETSAGVLPDGQKLFLSFEGGQMVLTAPSSFLDRLRSGTSESCHAKETSPTRGRPHWVSPAPPGSLGVGSRISWTAWAVDDSGGATADYRYSVEGMLPDGLTWNPARHRLDGVLSKKGEWRTVFRVQDGNGRSDTLVWKLGVDAANPVEQISDRDTALVLAGFELPWDTLTASRWVVWAFGEQVLRWEKSGTRLDSVESDLAETNWDGSSLSIRPRRSGTATFTFHMRRNGRVERLVRTCPVRPHPLPVFLSRTGGSFLTEGRTRTYRPVARDAYGGQVTLEADFPLDAPFEWDGEELRVAPRGPGAWSAKFTARDTLDHVAEQWVTFTSEARQTSRWSVESRWAAGTNSWTVVGEFGRGRISLFTPHPSRLFLWSEPLRQDWPFLLLGLNLLDAGAIRQGHAASLDVGGTLRLPNRAILTGGVAGRLRGRYDAQPALPWIFEGEMVGWVHQAILATDTSRLVDILDIRDSILFTEELKARFGPVLGQVMRDAFDRRNAVFLTRMEGWLQLPRHLAVAVGYWREDLPVRMELEQHLSTGLRWSPQGRYGALEATVRGGWGPDRSGFGAWWDLKWSSGILP